MSPLRIRFFHLGVEFFSQPSVPLEPLLFAVTGVDHGELRIEQEHPVMGWVTWSDVPEREAVAAVNQYRTDINGRRWHMMGYYFGPHCILSRCERVESGQTIGRHIPLADFLNWRES